MKSYFISLVNLSRSNLFRLYFIVKDLQYIIRGLIEGRSREVVGY